MTLLNYALVPWTCLVAGVVCSFFLLCAAPTLLIPRGTRERWNQWTNAGASIGILRWALYCRMVVEGRANLPDRGQGYLVVCNHRSFVDVLTLIWAARAEGVSKRAVFWFPIMGWLGYLGGAVFFDRSDPKDRARAKQEAVFLMGRGVPLHVYPEGTRTRTGDLRDKTHMGLVIAAWEAGIPAVPAVVWGSENVIPATNRGLRYGQTVRAHFRPPIQPGDFQTGEAFAAAVWDQVREQADELEEQFPATRVDLLPR
jgi:1-acyl-sn-glycerol-3-phosphate acyltransferase